MARRERVEQGVYRRSDGKLEIGWRDAGGRQRWRAVEGGIKAARAELATEHAKRAKGEQVPDSPRLTFRVAADAWFKTTIIRTRPASHLVYANNLRWLGEEFGSMRLSAITSSAVAAFVERQRAAGVPPSSTQGRLIVLGAIYKHAARRLGYKGANPVKQLERGERPAKIEPIRRILTDDELTALLNAIQPRHRLLFDTIAQTGLRQSEARGLIWSNFDPEAGTLTVDGQLSARGHQRVAPKTERSWRTITIAPSLVARLREHRLATGRPSDGELIFRHPGLARHGLRSYSITTFGEVIRLARVRAGLGPIMRGDEMIARAPVPHDLRHTHASRLIAAGWDVAEVSARLGDTIQTTLLVYAHEWDAVRRRADQQTRLEALYGSAMEAQDVSSARSGQMAAGGEIVDLQRKR
jgi:integrase